jgi:hypothetical protein
MFMDHCNEFHEKPDWANVRAFGQQPAWAQTADLEELKLNVEKFSDDLRTAEEPIRKLEEELALTETRYRSADAAQGHRAARGHRVEGVAGASRHI